MPEESHRALASRHTGLRAAGFAAALTLLAVHFMLAAMQGNGIMLLAHGFSSNHLQFFCLVAAMPLFIASLWGAPLSKIRSRGARWVRLLVTITSGALAIVLVGAWLLWMIPSAFTASKALHLLTSPGGSHTVLIENDSFLLSGQHDVYELTRGVVFEKKGTISTDDGYDPFGLNEYSARWDDTSVTFSFVDQHRPQSETIALGSNS